MIEFIKIARKRGVVTDLIHAVLNILFAGAAIYLTAVMESPWPAIILVFLSKWRVLAVRPRYWWVNFLSSLPDVIVGVGLVTITWASQTLGAVYMAQGQVSPVPVIAIQVIMAVIYSVWLIAIKPKHSQLMVGFQALASQFIGLTAIFFVSQRIPLAITLVLAGIVAFSSARQVLGMYEERNRDMLATVWGLLTMELAFVSWHWSVSYQITPLIRIPQIAIIVSAISVIAYRVYRSWHDDRHVTWEELGYPTIFTIALTVLILFVFSGLFSFGA